MSSLDDELKENLHSHSDEEGTLKLKMLVASLKKKYGDAVGQAYTLDTKCRELSSENSTLRQTQNALTEKFNETLVELQLLKTEKERLFQEHKTTHLVSEEAEQEIKALREQYSQLRELLQRHEDEARRAVDDLQAIKLKETQLERVIQFLRKRSEEAHLETTQMTQELNHAQEQAHQLSDELAKISAEARELREALLHEKSTNLQEKEELKALLEQLKVLSEDFHVQSELNEKLKAECEKLKEELHSQNTHYDTLQKEHIFMKQAMMRSVDEVKKELLEATLRHEQEKESAQKDLDQLKKMHAETCSKLNIEIDNFKSREGLFAENEALQKSLKQEKDQLLKEIDELKQQNLLLVGNTNELEQRFKTAQQHLAKKVRETALAYEKTEAEKLKSLELQNQLNLSQIKISELKNSLELEVEHQRRSLARESELLKNSEAQVSRLEAKYFQVHEQWKEAETEIRELKKVEEKWREAESLFSRMGQFSVSTNFKTPLKTLSEAAKENFNEVILDSKAPHESTEHQTLPPMRHQSAQKQQNLFDEPKSPPIFKDKFL